MNRKLFLFGCLYLNRSVSHLWNCLRSKALESATQTVFICWHRCQQCYQTYSTRTTNYFDRNLRQRLSYFSYHLPSRIWDTWHTSITDDGNILCLQKHFHQVEHSCLRISIQWNQHTSTFFHPCITNLQFNMLQIRWINTIKFIKLILLLLFHEVILFLQDF